MIVMGSKRSRNLLFCIAFLLPILSILTFVVFYPVATAIYQSFTNYSLMSVAPPKWIGLDNYVKMFGEKRFINAVGRTFYFTGGALSLELLLGLGVALLLNKGIKGNSVYRVLFLIPMLTTPLAVALIGRIMLNSTFGIITGFLEIFSQKEISLLGNERLVIPTLIVVDAWKWTPYVMIILLGGLYSLPKEVFDLAEVDGASKFQVFFHITLPLLKHHIIVATVLRCFWAFKAFDIIWGLTRAGPNFASETLFPYTYSMSFRFFHIGYGSAVGVVYFGILFGILLFFVSLRRTGWTY